jgi:type IV pilus assembly protein PilO
MATQANPPVPKSVDVAVVARNALSQFRDLNPNQPGQWPIAPRLTVWALTALFVVGVSWFLFLTDEAEALQTARDKEPTLKHEYTSKLTQAINLEALKKQKEQVEGYVKQLEKQLPGKAEMDALLTDINQAGVGRGLVIDQFVSGSFEVKDYYAELPISIRVTGKYHEIGAFAADVAALSRIVTLQNLVIAAVPTTGNTNLPPGTLSMEATARTYRYLDQNEVAEARKGKDKEAKK